MESEITNLLRKNKGNDRRNAHNKSAMAHHHRNVTEYAMDSTANRS